VFTLDDVSAIVCIIAKRGLLVECYNLKSLLASHTASNPVDVSKCLVAVIVKKKKKKKKKKKM